MFMPITQNMLEQLQCACMCVCALHMRLFFTYITLNIDKEDASPLCFTSIHAVPAKSKVHLKE